MSGFCLHIEGVTCDNCRYASLYQPPMPGPFKCPDCAMWWAGFAHRCSEPTRTLTNTTTGRYSPTSEVRCTCPPNRGDNYAGSCPIHDAQSTYTVLSS